MAMQWLEMCLAIDSETAEAVLEALARLGEDRVFLEHLASDSPAPSDTVFLKAYLPADDSLEERRAKLHVVLSLLASVRTIPSWRERLVEEEEWTRAWEEYFRILKVGRHVVIKPAWVPYQPAQDDVVVEIGPGLAFGTGYHPTTQMCLEALEHHLRPGDSVLDLGTGSGILAIAAARLGASHVLALDIEADAVKTATANVQVNGISSSVAVAQGSLPLAVESPHKRFDVVVANLTAQALIPLSTHLLEALAPSGVLIAGGIMFGRQGDVAESFRRAGAEVAEEMASGDWHTLVIRHRRSF